MPNRSSDMFGAMVMWRQMQPARASNKLPECPDRGFAGLDFNEDDPKIGCALPVTANISLYPRGLTFDLQRVG